ncbi:hypothetical protein ACRDNQ_07135 [Palleronia sp. KMU-117]|uniref:hypothetical protein n=1 Tax=Palleronia sp. KMU-117 TaxID=3434108 RepID=UPI003D722C35
MKAFLISILAAGLFATTPAAPARAEAQDLAGVVAGVVALGLIARAINQRNEAARAAAPEVARDNTLTRDAWRPWTTEARNETGRSQARLLPEACLVRVNGGGPDQFAYERQCLTRTYAHRNALPAHCEWKTRTDRGWRSVYGERCLAREGYRAEDRWARR